MKTLGTGFTTRLVCILLCTGGLMATAWATTPRHHVPRHVRTALQAAQTLDGVIQPQFQKDAGTFGVGRFTIAGHDGVYNFDTEHVPELKQPLNQIAAAHRPYAVEFMHCAHKPARFKDSKEIVDFSKRPQLEILILPGNNYYNNVDGYDPSGRQEKWDHEQQPALAKRVLPLAPQLRRGQPLQHVVGDWLVVMRPVLAGKASCLGCHRGAHRGDTLGVMVYVVSRKVLH
jgi:hypothetical protein